MEVFKFLLFSCFFLVCTCDPTNDGENAAKLAEGEKRLGDQIRAILKHYQQTDPVGFPGAPIPDPMPVPDMKHSFSIYTMNFKEINVYGLSKFRIDNILSELKLMQVSVSISIETLDIRGMYTLSSWFSSSNGDFTVKLTGVKVQGVARLEVGTDGKLQAQDIDMDLTFDNIDMDFKNLDFLGSVLQSVINSVGTFIFDSIKPFILKEVNTNIRGEINKQISQLPQYFPNSISPFDMAVAEARKQVSQMGYDPYRIKDYTQSMGIFTVTSSHTWITGLASFYRMGNITVTMEDAKVYALVDVGTQEIEGRTHWEVSVIGGALSRAGTVSFTIDYFRVQVNLSQPLDTRKRATLEELNLELGNIQARIHGAGTLDYIMEASVVLLGNRLTTPQTLQTFQTNEFSRFFGVKFTFNLSDGSLSLRGATQYQIMDALEGPIKRRIQDELDKVDVEKLIHEKIPDIEEKARFLQGLPPVDDILLEGPPPSLQDEEDQGPFSESEEERGPS